ncbi:hypothetical protein KUW17_16775 [Leisingera aquaemixtae]|uniref:hypothetical protein n=1 Tax=Leisingera aquaemixtae TaxID=1396826 RepID=UPI001C98DACE|nr:hypothetical protein [Leisingera aquaemixtae]MBY6068404.1 hypothetical protein [Leisingera aquaemixtae]
MLQKALEDLVRRIRRAAASEDHVSAIRAVLQDSQAQREKLADAIAALEDDEVMVFEDKSCSIWTCR